MAKGDIHRVVVETDRDQYLRLKGKLATRGQTVSDFFRQKIDEELRESVKGQYRTDYGKSKRN